MNYAELDERNRAIEQRRRAEFTSAAAGAAAQVGITNVGDFVTTAEKARIKATSAVMMFSFAGQTYSGLDVFAAAFKSKETQAATRAAMAAAKPAAAAGNPEKSGIFSVNVFDRETGKLIENFESADYYQATRRLVAAGYSDPQKYRVESDF